MAISLKQEIEKGIQSIKNGLNDIEKVTCLLFEKALRSFSDRSEKEYLDMLCTELFVDKRANVAKAAFRACQILSSTSFDVEDKTYNSENFELFFSKKAGIFVGRNFDRGKLAENYKTACIKYGKDNVVLSLSGLGKAKKPSQDPIKKAVDFLREIDTSYNISRAMSEDDLPTEHKKNLQKLEAFCKTTGNTYKQFHEAMELLAKLK